ncbi:unnamed protein product [Acanthoscelides obtectus]|uniref:Uncharacterized protein n=1 Tax=Acanthoscelides obtectus TaxID=200917 RepID=A0A9P0JKH2_ACAOB|nr:unnamed protein product [Acanthoscelides obtectus]CAK1655025.1 hypothetical protein AOBTE_LOCUS18971 [Acanthoscelides obtectus]
MNANLFPQSYFRGSVDRLPICFAFRLFVGRECFKVSRFKRVLS